MDRHRLLELAIEEIERQKLAVETEIKIIRAELRGSAVPRSLRSASFTTGKRRSRTPAERRAQSRRMRAYWAAKRNRGAKKNAGAPKPRVAINKAISDAMRVYWAKRKAKANSKEVPKKLSKAQPPAGEKGNSQKA